MLLNHQKNSLMLQYFFYYNQQLNQLFFFEFETLIMLGIQWYFLLFDMQPNQVFHNKQVIKNNQNIIVLQNFVAPLKLLSLNKNLKKYHLVVVGQVDFYFRPSEESYMRLSSHTAQVNYYSKCLQFTNLKWAILYVCTKYTK